VCSTSASVPPDDARDAQAQPASTSEQAEAAAGGIMGWWKAQQQRSAVLRTKLVALGPAAVLAYGGWSHWRDCTHSPI
jgi:hypothetical protein